MNQRNYRKILFISLCQFVIAFSFNFVLVFLLFPMETLKAFKENQTNNWYQ
jgi:hypothetical protein